jgi:hypothetical protein
MLTPDTTHPPPFGSGSPGHPDHAHHMTTSPARDVVTPTATAQPERVAIPPDPAAFSLEEADELTQTWSTFCGGNYWPVVPSDGRRISEDRRSVLDAVRPDGGHTICELGNQLHDRIRRRLAPDPVMCFGSSAMRRVGSSAPADTDGAIRFPGWREDLAFNRRIGPADAPYRLVVWTDYQCPACRQFEKGIAMRLAGDSLPLDSLLMASAIRDRAGFRRCFSDSTSPARARVEADARRAHALHLRGTPGVQIGDRIASGALPVTELIPRLRTARR